MKTEMKVLIAVVSMLAMAFVGVTVADDVDAAESIDEGYKSISDEDLEKYVSYVPVSKTQDLFKYKVTAEISVDEISLDGNKHPQYHYSVTNISAPVTDDKTTGKYAASNIVKNVDPNKEGLYYNESSDSFYIKVSATVTFMPSANQADNISYNVDRVFMAPVSYEIAPDDMDITFNGSPRSFTEAVFIEGFELVYYKGANNVTNVGTYETTFKIKYLENFVPPIKAKWSIVPKDINDDTVDGKLVMVNDQLVLKIWDTEYGAEALVYEKGSDKTGTYLREYTGWLPYVIFGADFVAEYFYPAEEVDDKVYYADATGMDNYKGTRSFEYKVTFIEGILNVNTIVGDGYISAETFEGKIFVFPTQKPYGEAIPSEGYFITVKDGWGQLVFTNNPAEIEMAKKYGVAQTNMTSSEWNYIEINGNEDNGYFGCVVGSFCMEFTDETSGLIFNAAGTKVIGYNGTSTNVVIPATHNGLKVTKIADRAFKDNKIIESVVIGDNVAQVGMKAFANCTNLKSVVFGDSVKIIYSYAFLGCKNLEMLDFGLNLTNVKLKAFGSVTLQDVNGNEIEAVSKNLKGNTFVGSKGVLKALA